jgi:hypothetical protein
LQLSDLHKQSVQQALQDSHGDAALTASAAHPYLAPSGAQCPVLRCLGGHDAPDAHLYVSPPPSEAPSPAAGGEEAAGLKYLAPAPAVGMFPPVVVKVPMRVQQLNFWASTRVVQRLIMVSNNTLR